MIRGGTLDDAPGVARLLAAVYPDEVESARGLRHAWASVPERVGRRSWAAEVDGELVAWANASRVVASAAEGAGFAKLTVHPDHRGRGIGTAMWDEVERHLGELGVTEVTAEGIDEPGSRRFMAARRFDVASVERTSGLDPRALGEPSEPAAGVEVRPFASFGDPRPVYELTVETVRDIPTEHPIDDVRWDEWLEAAWRSPDLDHDVSLVVLVDGEPAALTYMLVNREARRAVSSLTGTARRFRGRGLARLAKHHALARLAGAGITLAVANNHETNPAMLAVNERLGYRPLATRLTFTRG